MKNIILNSILAALLTLTLSSCASLNTNQRQGTAIDATLGGLTGNQLGQYMDYQEQELRNVMAASEASSIRGSQYVLVATFKGETYFAHNSTVLKAGGYQEISRTASVLNKYPNTRIQVGGHTDQRGSEQYNQQLSWQRAEAVQNALVQHSVSPSLINTQGYGESNPISSSYANNRRVEFTISPMG